MCIDLTHPKGIVSDEIEADGFIIPPEMVTLHSPWLARLMKNNTPRIVLGRNTSNVALDFVCGDESGILNEFLRGLFNVGHRKIALFVSEPHYWKVAERIKVFRELCQVLGVEYSILNPEIKYHDDRALSCESYLHAYIDSHRGQLPFTALITLSLNGSNPALRVLHDWKIRVPEQCSVCCLGTDPNALYGIPSLTNAMPHHDDLGEACLRLLELRLNGDVSPLLHEIIAYRVCWRESSGHAQ